MRSPLTPDPASCMNYGKEGGSELIRKQIYVAWSSMSLYGVHTPTPLLVCTDCFILYSPGLGLLFHVSALISLAYLSFLVLLKQGFLLSQTGRTEQHFARGDFQCATGLIGLMMQMVIVHEWVWDCACGVHLCGSVCIQHMVCVQVTVCVGMWVVASSYANPRKFFFLLYGFS